VAPAAVAPQTDVVESADGIGDETESGPPPRDEEEEAAAAEDAAILASESQRIRSAMARFETLAKRPMDERVALAGRSAGEDLFALSFDKEPDVARALWQNPHASVDHARFGAFHHRSTQGLDFLANRNELARDLAVQRRLLRNPLVGEGLVRKLLGSRRLIEIYKLSLDREAAERTRQVARALLRNRFATTDPEDRVELIWKTEGRSLSALAGMTIDSKTASLICARNVTSLTLVQSFTRFSATPPTVIAFLVKQPLVKRQVHVRNALLKHANCPSEVKRAAT
jgi:hypothetical protein